MIVFISDLHLTDGTFCYKENPEGECSICHDISAEAFKLFWDEILRIVEANRDESRIDKIEVVLLGDIFEMRSSTRWVASDYREDGSRFLNRRPWKENREDEPSEVCRDVLKGIFEHNRESLKYLVPRRFSEVDASEGLRRLVGSGVSINFTYVSGNHDRLVNFFGGRELIKTVEDELGWKTTGAVDGVPAGFRVMDEVHAFFADHGHQGDIIDFCVDSSDGGLDMQKGYLDAPIGSLLSDLLGRLMYLVQKTGNKSLIRFGMDIDNVRPSSQRLTWALANLPDDEESLEELRSAFEQGFEELHQDFDEVYPFLLKRLIPHVRLLGGWARFLYGAAGLLLGEDLIVSMAGKKMKKEISRVEKKLEDMKGNLTDKGPLLELLDDLKKRIGKTLVLKKKPKKEIEEQDQDFHYYERAEKEARSAGMKYIVFGHSHRFKIVPLCALEEDQVFYFNTGTWKKTVQKNVFGRESFQKWTRMTYVIFFDVSNRENKDHVFDVWHGNLQTTDDF